MAVQYSEARHTVREQAKGSPVAFRMSSDERKKRERNCLQSSEKKSKDQKMIPGKVRHWGPVKGLVQ